jgi:hypothetical protein
VSGSNPHSITLEHDRPKHDSPKACYRPAIFLRHLHLIAFLLPEGKKTAIFTNAVVGLFEIACPSMQMPG